MKPAAGPAADLLITGADVVTMDAERRVLTGGAIAIVRGTIAAVGATESARARYPSAPELDAEGCIVVPGMVNAHQHTTASPLTRSLVPESVTGDESIFEWSVPTHAAVTADDDEVSAALVATESLLHGVTTLLDPGTVAHPEAVARGLRAAGIRGRVGCWGWDVAGQPHAGTVGEVLERQEATVHAIGTHGTVTGWVTLVGHALASDALFEGAAALAERLDVGITWHLSPSDADVRSYAVRSGLRPVEHLRRLGVLGPRVLLGHAVWIDAAELEALLDSGTAVASCPAAYARLGQGLVRAGRHPELARRGGRVALGCDAHNAGDDPDVLRAAWLLAALDRDRGGPDPFRADEAFALATVDGAQAVGLGDTVGSIEVGKQADLVVLDGDDLAWTPRGDYALQLVYGSGGRAVRDVLVAGRVVVRDRKVTTLDVAALRTEARRRSAELIDRAGLTARPRWPVSPAPPLADGSASPLT
jgi:5-methylthioadenosine/S-adenosylhomocysteine deaminase